MNKEEESEQVAFVGWFRVQYPHYKALINIVSIGENVGPRRMARLKKMGLTPGWPDLLLAIPGPRSLGLFIEMKSKKGRLHGGQPEIHSKLIEQGYKVTVCYSFEDARNVTKEYLSEKLKSCNP
jgi:hypothetical protein